MWEMFQEEESMRNIVERLIKTMTAVFLAVGLIGTRQTMDVHAESCDGVTFDIPLTNEYLNSLPKQKEFLYNYTVLPEGNYYLTEDLNINEGLLITGGIENMVHLYLNGHNITMNGDGDVIRLKGDASTISFFVTTLHIHEDHNIPGEIRHGGSGTGTGITVGRDARLYLHGGKITNNTWSGYGGGISLFRTSRLIMSGGEISGNKAAQGGGVYFNGAATAQFSGKVNIEGNTDSGNVRDDIFLIRGAMLDIFHTENLKSGSRIGIRTEAKPSGLQITQGVQIWKENPHGISTDFFFSDDPQYAVKASGGNGYLTYDWDYQYTVTFKTNCSSVIAPQKVKSMLQATQPEVDNPGYTLAGWFTDYNCTKPYNFDSAVTSDITLYAKWTPNTYEVTFDPNGGGVAPAVHKMTVTYDSVYGTLPVPINLGRKFLGWYTSADGGEEITASSIVKITKDTKFYAHWQTENFTVVWLNDDGSVLETDTEVSKDTVPTYNGETPEKAADAQYTYKFSGWTPEIKPVTGDAAYTATYTPTVRTYTVTWKNSDGTVLETDENVEYNATPSYDKSGTPTKNADAQYTYTFSGWTPTVSKVTGDITYTAEYDTTVNKYIVNFMDEDGTTTLDSGEFEYGSFPVFKGSFPVKDGKVFSRWNPELATVTDSATYSAVYSESAPTTCKVKFVDKTGTPLKVTVDGIEKEEVEYRCNTAFADIVKPADPAPIGTNEYVYTFAGWLPEVTSITGDVTFAAQYTQTPQVYTITWVDGDGNTIRTDPDQPFGAKLNTEGLNPTKQSDSLYDYTFNGNWKGKSSQRFDVVRGTDTFTAQFDAVRKQSYTITWLNDDGSVLETDTEVSKSTVPTYNGDTPEKASNAQYSYIFDGWDKPIAAATCDISYKATYRPIENQYTVTLKYPDGSEETKVCAYNGTISEPSSEEIERFSGWLDENGSPFDFNTPITQNIVLTVGQYDYRFVDDSFTWVLGTGGDQEVTAKRFVGSNVSEKDTGETDSTFIAFESNGMKLYADGSRIMPDEEFTDKAGSVIFDLSGAFLNQLKPGVHTLRAEFTDGTAELGFRVVDPNATEKDERSEGEEDRKTAPLTPVNLDLRRRYVPDTSVK